MYVNKKKRKKYKKFDVAGTVTSTCDTNVHVQDLSTS